MYYIIIKATQNEEGKRIVCADLHEKEYIDLDDAVKGLDAIQNELENYEVTRRSKYNFIATRITNNTVFYPALYVEIVQSLL